MTIVKFSKANAKTEALKQVDELKPYLEGKRKIYSLDLLSGYSCPYAHDCLSKAVADENGKRKIKDGPHTKFRCFSASQEVQYTNVYNSRKHNFDTLRGLHVNDMIALLNRSMPSNLGICRIHVAGDFFSSEYMLAWITMAMMHQDRLFYAYTKSLKYWLKHWHMIDLLPNFVLTASYGGRNDNLISERALRCTKVVFSEAEASKLGLEIDHDDSHAARPSLKDQDFALLIHGTQPKGSEASEALRALNGKGSYSRKRGLTLEKAMV
tara:strand:+ start:415 stop:1215 length:801 start_codon:yes stop_codon:yes gene_type:complete